MSNDHPLPVSDGRSAPPFLVFVIFLLHLDSSGINIVAVAEGKRERRSPRARRVEPARSTTVVTVWHEGAGCRATSRVTRRTRRRTSRRSAPRYTSRGRRTGHSRLISHLSCRDSCRGKIGSDGRGGWRRSSGCVSRTRRRRRTSRYVETSPSRRWVRVLSNRRRSARAPSESGGSSRGSLSARPRLKSPRIVRAETRRRGESLPEGRRGPDETTYGRGPKAERGGRSRRARAFVRPRRFSSPAWTTYVAVSPRYWGYRRTVAPDRWLSSETERSTSFARITRTRQLRLFRRSFQRSYRVSERIFMCQQTEICHM